MDFMPFLVVPLWTSILHLDFVKGSFVVDVTQSSYQAEENHNITLEWTFTTKPDTSISALKVFCILNNGHKYWTFYHLFDGVEFSEDQDKKFSGRVQSDKDALREGRIRLQLSRLRTEDSGLYLCEVDTGYGRGYNSCRLTVSGEVLVIGSNLPIIAAPGDDVILPCHLEPMFDVQGMTVEWSKPDLKPNPSDRLSRVEYVHLYRDRQEVPDMKMASYFRRTELFMDDMKHGNISLKILNVSEEDNGRYRCFIPKLRSRLKAAVVELVVDPNFAKTSTTETPLHFQTPDPQDATPANGRSRVSVVAVVITFMSVLVVVAFSACFSRCLHQKLNKLSEGKTTQSQV
uniref:V-set domain-containing T-cell activation inhibitor 1 isoform X2 n=1 Tax=Maylandia zebra TaxID=106582 RepID=UPI000D321337|nr:V-set domain-containing T-cell activation inhibitor 1 isoform X2 [Maylandia zebra]